MPPLLREAAGLDISVRPITDDDLPFVATLYTSTRAAEMAATGWPEEMQGHFLAQQHNAQHRQYRRFHPDAEWLLIERGGSPIGRLYLESWSSRILLIDISLLTEAQSQGIGSAILRDLIEEARRAGKAISLHVEARNPVRGLYERLGFAVAEDGDAYVRMEWQPSKG